VCTYHIKSFRDQAAAGHYVRPKMLQNGPSELALSVGLTSEQSNKLEKHWEEFVQEIQTARSRLGRYTSSASDKVEASLKRGTYNPASSADAAKVSFHLFYEHSLTFMISRCHVMGRSYLFFGFVKPTLPLKVSRSFFPCSVT